MVVVVVVVDVQGSLAAMLACSIFGRDEEGSPFVFTQKTVDTMLLRWALIMRAEGHNKSIKPTKEAIQVLELCVRCESAQTVYVCSAADLCTLLVASADGCLSLVLNSDVNKPLLLANQTFLSYLNDGLLLDPAHPHAGLPAPGREWLQETHIECFAQLAVFPAGERGVSIFDATQF
eukprot:COSAG01_NODE_343_length_18564_cov_10.381099_3_plen_177_part_00